MLYGKLSHETEQYRQKRAELLEAGVHFPKIPGSMTIYSMKVPPIFKKTGPYRRSGFPSCSKTP